MREKVQENALRIVPEFSILGYEERTETLNLSTLEEMKMKGDIIICECIGGHSDVNVDQFFEV